MTPPDPDRYLSARVQRLLALVRKEGLQMRRDPSTIAIGVLLPSLLILLFGYGLSLDVKHVPLAVVLEAPSPEAAEIAAGFELSPYVETRTVIAMQQAEELMRQRRVDGIVRIRSDFARPLALGRGAVEILLHGSDANYARLVQGYAQGAIDRWSARRIAEGRSFCNT